MLMDPRLVFQLIASIAGFFLNSFLAVIILITKSEAVGKYKYLLFLYVGSSALLTTCHILTTATFVVSGHAWIFYDSLQILPYPLNLILLVEYSVGFLQLFLILTISFIFRYLAVCRPIALRKMTKNTWFPIVFLSLSLLMYHTFLLIVGALPSSDCESAHGQDFKDSTGLDLSDVAYVCIRLTHFGKLQLKGILTMLDYFVFLTISGTIICFCAFKITFSLRKPFIRSDSFHHNQKNIFLLLLVIPMILCAIPANLIVLFAIFELRINTLEHYIGCMFSISPVLEPILIIFFMKKYRLRMKALICRSDVNPEASYPTITQGSRQHDNAQSQSNAMEQPTEPV